MPRRAGGDRVFPLCPAPPAAGRSDPLATRPGLLNDRLAQLTDYPFQRLTALLDGIDPPAGLAPISFSIGEPRHAPPPMVAEIVAAHAG